MMRSAAARAAVAALCLLAALLIVAPAASADWNQYCGNAAHTCKSESRGPVRPALVPGWPYRCEFDCNGVFGLGQVGRDRQPAVFSGSNLQSTLFGVGPDGLNLPGSWPIRHAPTDRNGTIMNPVVYPASGDTKTVYALRAAPPLQALPLQLHAYGIDGREMPGFPVAVDNAQWPTFLTLSERIGTGRETIYFSPYPLTPGQPSPSCEDRRGQIRALGLDGSQNRGWPVTTSGSPTAFGPGPAIGPDGTVYLATSKDRCEGMGGTYSASYTLLEALNPDGTARPGFPVTLSPANGPSRWIGQSGAAVAGDGTVYVGAGSAERDQYWAQPGQVYAVTPTGAIKPGWPVTVAGAVIGTPTIADDNTIYVSSKWESASSNDETSYVYAFDSQGNPKPGWPVEIDHAYSGTTIVHEPVGIAADHDGNVYFGAGERVYSYDSAGRPRPGWPYQAPWTRFAWAAIAGDGTLYVLGLRQNGNSIYAFRTMRLVPHRVNELRRLPPSVGVQP